MTTARGMRTRRTVASMTYTARQYPGRLRAGDRAACAHRRTAVRTGRTTAISLASAARAVMAAMATSRAIDGRAGRATRMAASARATARTSVLPEIHATDSPW